jgi:hypothetical protein
VRLTASGNRQASNERRAFIEQLENRIVLNGNPVWIVDDFDPGFYSTTGFSRQVFGGAGFGGDRTRLGTDVANDASGKLAASWTFDDLEPGVYRVSATWVANSTWAQDARFVIRSGASVIHSAVVNQQVAPLNHATESDGTLNFNFQDLGSTFTLAGDSLTVEVDNTHTVGTRAIADAIRLERISSSPTAHTSDDRDAATAHTSFETVGVWVDNGNTAATHLGDRLLASSGTGQYTATWRFDNLVPGLYRVSTTWQAHPTNRNTVAPFSLYDSNGYLVRTETVNQRVAPQANMLVGPANTPFQFLGAPIAVSGDAMHVVLANLGAGTVVADAIHIERVGDLPSILISDDRDAATEFTSFDATSGWVDNGDGSNTYQGDRLLTPIGDGSEEATWTFANLAPGVYQISTTWQAHATDRTTAAPYRIFDGAALIRSVKVNQRNAPQSDVIVGPGNTSFQHLGGPLLVLGATITVKLASDGLGSVAADAVRIERVADVGDVPIAPQLESILEYVDGSGATKDDYAQSNVVFSPHPAKVDGIELWRSIGGIGTPDTTAGWELAPSQIDLASADATSVDRLGRVYHQRQFYYIVRAYSEDGYSAWSNVVKRNYPAPEDKAVLVSAEAGPASITLSWPETLASPNSNYRISRKLKDATAWTTVIDNSQGATQGISSWTDTDVDPGDVYEYRVERLTGGSAVGYILAGIAAPLVDQRGTVLLVIEGSQVEALAPEIERLERDLFGDGWRVVRVIVSASDTPAFVKARIADAHDLYGDLKSVLLLGHVPVPRSGVNAPDNHPPRALPADTYYADLDGTWTDAAENFDGWGTDPRLDNFPNDGHFDQETMSGALPAEISVGRIDMNDLPLMGAETDLLRGYLDKLHAFRNGGFTVERRAHVNDHFFNAPGPSVWAQWGWQSFTTMFGADNVDQNDQTWVTTLDHEAYLWALGQGYGIGGLLDPSGIDSVVHRNDYAATSFKAVFNSFASSYTMDYDDTNAFLRTPLANDGYGLTAFWHGNESFGIGGSPLMHRMALGGTIGDSFRLSHNGLQSGFNGAFNNTYSNLLGDPTLRLHIVQPASNLVAVPAGEGAQLSWTASPDPSVAGYYVYKHNASTDRFERVDCGEGDLHTATTCTDPTGNAATDVYMVRAVKLEQSGSGTYWNASTGVFSNDAAVAAEALPYTVNSTADLTNPPTNQMTLRSAVLAANAHFGGVIALPAGDYTLAIAGIEDAAASGDLDITSNIIVVGAGAGATVIDAAGLDRVFHVLSGGSLTLRGLTVTGGSAQTGGGVRADAGSNLELVEIAVAGNQAIDSGGGVYTAATQTTLLDSVITANSATGNSNPSSGGGLHVASQAPIAVSGTIIALNVASIGDADWFHATPASLSSLGDNLFGSVPAALQSELDPSDLVDSSVDFVVASRIDSNRTTPASFDLSAREAVMQTNLVPGADMIWLPAWDLQLTIVRLPGLDSDAAYGDLDVKESLTVRGVDGRTSVTWANGLVDRVFDLIGDYNRNGIVDSADLTIWQNSYGYGEISNITGDGNHDGIVDSEDYDVWFTNFGQSGQGIPGDYNGDGIVDAADYSVWEDNQGAVWSPDVAGDGDDDGDVDGRDYMTWSQSFGKSLAILGLT